MPRAATSHELKLIEMTNQLVKTGLKGETNRKVLHEASGQVGLNQVYRAPIYQTYGECIQGLYRQGILGFYKGNGWRLFHVFAYAQNRTWI